MWQRWGSPELSDFSTALAGDPGLVSVKALVGLGAAIQLPATVADEILDIPIRAASDAYLTALGLPPAVGVDYIPLTSSILSAIRIDIPGIVNAGLIDREITDRWNEDMGGIQDALRFTVRSDPDSSTLANGAMGPLLGMRPNAAYLGVPSYTDPPLPWRPSLMVVPPEPRVEAAADLLSRTFVEAHADDWCAVLSVDGQDEFSVDWLRRRCSALTIQDDPDADVACSVCTRMAEWFVVAQPDDAVDPELLLPGVCSLLADHEGIPVSSRPGDDRTALAARWCGPAVQLEGLSVERIQGCEGDPDATMIRVRVVDLDGEPVAGVRVTFSLDDVTVGSGTSNDDGVAEYLYDEADNALRVVKADVNGADVAGEFLEELGAPPQGPVRREDHRGREEVRHVTRIPRLGRRAPVNGGVMDAVRVELDRVVPSRVRARRWAFDGTDRKEIAFAPTAHAGLELAWIEEGAIRYRLDGEVVDVRAGQAMLVPTGVDHATIFVGPMRGASVHLDDGMIARVADAAQGLLPERAGVVLDGATVATLGALLVQELARDTLDARLCADALAEALAVKALGGRWCVRGDERDPRVVRAIDVIRARFAEDIDVDEIASAAGSSRFHLSRLFKGATGKSPYRYLVDVRLEHAASLLRGRRSVTDAALSSGFSDLSRFARMFRERYGVAPRAYSSSWRHSR